MNQISMEDINNIRSSINIVDVISSYIPLINRGKNYFGVCPFHDDHSPSMSVSPEKQIYTCFSCGATGNVFKFVMDYEHVSYYESIGILANRAGIDVKLNLNKKDTSSKNSDLYNIYDLAKKVYQNNLNTENGIKAKKYLFNRDISEEVIKNFEIGLSLKKNTIITDLLLKKKYSQDIMIKSGLVIKSEKGLSDIYYNRIMFPLNDLNGQVVGFSGRIYDGSKDNSKYINTKETEIFKKGELLYNYHRAKDYCRETNTVIIMEGFMDVIRAYMINVKNVIATMGTAVTKNQANLIKRMAKNVLLCFDGDAAGVKATLSCSEELLKIGVIPKIISLDDGLDPDEYIKKYGKESFLSKIDNPINIMDFKLKQYKNKYNLTSNEETSKYVNSIIKELSDIDDDVLVELTLKKLSEEVKLDYQFLKDKMNNTIPKKQEVIVNDKISKRKLTQREKAENSLIYYMLRNKEAIKEYKKNKVYIDNNNKRFLCREIVIFYENYNKIDIADFISQISQDEVLMRTFSEIQLLGLKDECTIPEIKDYIKVIKKYNIDEYCNKLKEEMKKEIDSSKKAIIAKKIFDLKQGEIIYD